MRYPLSDKQVISFEESNKRINIWEGSVRSGKSFVSILRLIKELRYGPKGHVMIVGPTRDSIQRNVLSELCELLGFPVPTPKATQMMMFGRTIHLVGASDERSQRRIQGATLACAYVDEITLIPHGFLKMLLSRLSVPNAKLFATTNPDSPFHWLKTEFLDRKNELNMATWKFKIDDNPSLDKTYVDSLKAEYTGLWYKRYIEGEWVLADGTVYDFFDEEKHVIDFPTKRGEYYIVGIDYGTTNPTVFTLIGYNPAGYPNIWMEREYYYNSKDHNRQKTDTEYAEDLKKFIKGVNVQAIYLDPSAASFRAELSMQGVDQVCDADNDVLNGIRFCSQLLANGTFKVSEACRNTVREFATYVWDTKASEKGEDKPVKKFDHCFVSGTQVLTESGYKSIEAISIGEKVKTRSGWNKVLHNFMHEANVCIYNILGKEITCTPDHLFLTLNGWKESSRLIQSDILFVELEELPWQKQLFSTESNIDVIQSLKTVVTKFTSKQESKIALMDLDISIEIFGSTTMEKYLPSTIFITSTRTPTTMTLAISNVYQLVSTFPIMERILQKSKEKLEESMQKESDHLQRSGTQVKREEGGIQSMRKILSQKEPLDNLHVINVDQFSQQKSSQTRGFVRIVVKVHGEEIVTLMMSRENVYFAGKSSQQINTQKEEPAVSLVQQRKDGLIDVYNLHVEHEHEYFVEGILVHNCLDSMRYALFTHFGNSLGGNIKPEDIDKMYAEARGYSQNIPRVFEQPHEMGGGSYY